MKHVAWGLLLGIVPLLSPAPLDSRAAFRPSNFAGRSASSRSSRAARSNAHAQTAVSIFPVAAATYDSGGYGARSVAIADVNHDGKPDLIVADRCQSGDVGCVGLSGGEVGVLLGNGDGTFQAAVMYPTGAFEGRGVTVADFNGDGKPDIAVASFCLSAADCSPGSPGAVSILLNNGSGTFQAPVIYGSAGSSAFDSVAADFNGDGKLDLAVVNRCPLSNCASISGTGVVGVLLNTGDGTFQAAVPYNSTGSSGQALAVGDVNGDGKPDLVEVDQCGVSGNCKDNSSPVSVFLANGDGTFQPAQQYLTGGQPAYSVALGDLNGDGKPDLVVANQCVTPTTCDTSTNGGVAVLLNNGDGTFQGAVSYTASGTTTSWVDIADVDGDGHADVVAVNYCADSTCAIGSVDLMLGNGDGTLQAPQTFATGEPDSYMAAVGDATGNGRLDVVTANECSATDCNDGTLSVFLNVPFGVTAPAAWSPSSVNLGQSATATITIAGAQGFTDTVNLACTVTGVQNPPQTPAPTCSFSPSASISGGSGAATLTVATVGSTQSAVSGTNFFGKLNASWAPLVGLAIFGLCLGSSGARRLRLSIGMLLIAALMLLSSCGAGGSGGGGGGNGCPLCTAVGNYNVSVTATDATNGKLTEIVTLPLLNVQ